MTLREAIGGHVGSFVSINSKRYYVGNIFDTATGHDGKNHPVVGRAGSVQLFGNFGQATGSEVKRLVRNSY